MNSVEHGCLGMKLAYQPSFQNLFTRLYSHLLLFQLLIQSQNESSLQTSPNFLSFLVVLTCLTFFLTK